MKSHLPHVPETKFSQKKTKYFGLQLHVVKNIFGIKLRFNGKRRECVLFLLLDTPITLSVWTKC